MKFNFKAFILALIFCTVLISVKNVYSCDLNANIERGLNGALRMREIDELYAGSSMFRGLNPYELEKKTERIFILQYAGLDPAMISLLLENLIDRGLSLKNFYIDMYAWTATKQPWLSESILLFESPFNLKLQIWDLMKQNKNADLISAAWEMFIHSGNDMFIFWPIYSRLVEGAHHKGGNLKSHYAVKSSSSRKEKFPDIPEEEFASEINPLERDAIIKIINLCRENNINLTFIETPKHSATNNSKKYQAIMRKYLNIMNENNTKCIMAADTLMKIHAEKSNNITSYEFEHDNLNYFDDYVHLAPAGNVKFTELLVTIN